MSLKSWCLIFDVKANEIMVLVRSKRYFPKDQLSIQVYMEVTIFLY